MKRSAIVRSVPLARTGKPKAKRGTSAASAKRKADDVWRLVIRQRDKVCQVCGRDNGILAAHHVMIRSFSLTRTDEDNGLLACYQCHQDKLHGDPLEAVKFYTRRYGVEGYADLRKKALSGVGMKFPASYWIAERERLQSLLGALDG